MDDATMKVQAYRELADVLPTNKLNQWAEAAIAALRQQNTNLAGIVGKQTQEIERLLRYNTNAWHLVGTVVAELNAEKDAEIERLREVFESWQRDAIKQRSRAEQAEATAAAERERAEIAERNVKRMVEIKDADLGSSARYNRMLCRAYADAHTDMTIQEWCDDLLARY